jgi:hypothetical protein
VKESTHIYALVRAAWSHECHLTRIENAASGGIPDLNVFHSRSKQEFWLECKIETSRENFVLRPSQYAWFIRRTKLGGRNIFVLSRYGDTFRLWVPVLNLQSDPVLSFSVAWIGELPLNYDKLLYRITQLST